MYEEIFFCLCIGVYVVRKVLLGEGDVEKVKNFKVYFLVIKEFYCLNSEFIFFQNERGVVWLQRESLESWK